MAIAYEKYLVEQSYRMSEMDESCNDHENNIGYMLFLDCQEQHPLAFEMVERVGHDSFSGETFKQAARIIIKNVFEK
jgi:hypothetical protein